jgi:Fur family transcriptional regulator, ferric uptake regulator
VLWERQVDMHADRNVQAETWLKRLAENGYRLTTPRQSVVEIIALSDHVLSPLDVYERARKLNPGIGLVTIYRTVEKLEELGLIQRVHQPSGCHSFVAASSGHQHILICQGCGRVEFFSGDAMDKLIESVGVESGYQVHEHWLQLFGTCKECTAR